MLGGRTRQRPAISESKTPTAGPARPPTRWHRAVEIVVLGLAPLLGAVAAQAPPMSVGLQSRWMMIDPWLYTAYIEHPTDLMTRFGGDDYYWVRLGFLLPAQAAEALLGPVGGFVVLRYVFALVAIVPGFVLIGRIAPRAVAWCFVAAVVTSPVVLSAWGSDYPDSAALSYLLGGAGLMLLPVTTRRGAVSARIGAGIALGLAANAHPAAVPLAGALLVGALLAPSLRGRGRDVVASVVSAFATTGAIAGIAFLRWGDADIVTPTVRQFLRLQQPAQVALWHSTTWQWADRDTYLLVPPMLLLALATTWVVRRRWPVRPVAGVAVAAALCMAFAVVAQASDGFSLEYYYYSSLQWWSVPFLLALLVGEVVVDRPEIARVSVAAVLLMTIIGAVAKGAVLRFGGFPIGVGLAVLVILVSALLVARPCPNLLASAGIVGIVGITWMITIGQPRLPYAPGQVSFPLVDYAAVSSSDTARAVDVYRVVAEIPAQVPSGLGRDDAVLTWAPLASPGEDLLHDPVRQGAAQYLDSRLSSRMPQLTPTDATVLDRARPGTVLVLLSPTGREFPGADAALERWRPQMQRSTVLVSGTARVFVQVMRLS